MIRRTFYVAVLVISVVALTLLIFRSDKTRTFTASSISAMVVPQKLKNDIDKATARQGNIAIIQVVTIHFQRNIQVDTYTSIEGTELQDIYDSYTRAKVIETPFFDSDPSNNRRMLKLINGEFTCAPFNNLTSGSISPAADRYISTVCSIGIPPRNYGEFTGVLNIYLKNSPDPAESNSIYLFARDLSVKVYDANKSSSYYVK